MTDRQRIAAYGVCVDAQGRVLLARAAPSLSLHGRWFLPGGGVDHGEHPTDALHREMEEEAGLTVVLGPLLDVLSDVRTAARRDEPAHRADGLPGVLVDGHPARRAERDDRRRPVGRPGRTGHSPPGPLCRGRRGAVPVSEGGTPHHVVIVGSGFGGLFAAKALRTAPVRVTLIDRTNHHLFQPLLYQVATGILSEGRSPRPHATCCGTTARCGWCWPRWTPSIRWAGRSCHRDRR